MADRIIAACGGDVGGKTVAILGLAFKPETDDMRDAPSLSILPKLVAAGAVVRAYDPEAMDHAKSMLPAGLHYAANALDAAQGADCVVLLTEWNEFRALSPEKLAGAMKGRVLLDLRNVYEPAAMREAGFLYHSIGRA
jgi:UDPglucose 6-dehydrogenase